MLTSVSCEYRVTTSALLVTMSLALSFVYCLLINNCLLIVTPNIAFFWSFIPPFDTFSCSCLSGRGMWRDSICRDLATDSYSGVMTVMVAGISCQITRDLVCEDVWKREHQSRVMIKTTECTSITCILYITMFIITKRIFLCYPRMSDPL